MDTGQDIPQDPGRLRLARNLRRVGLVAMFVFVAAGIAGLFDTVEGEGIAEGAGAGLEVSFPERARAGLDSTLELTITRAGGFEKAVRVAVDRDWLSLFQVSGIAPQPDTETGDPENVIWEFEPPPGDTLEVTADLTLRPALRGGKPGRVAVLGDDDAELAAFEFDTGIAP